MTISGEALSAETISEERRLLKHLFKIAGTVETNLGAAGKACRDNQNDLLLGAAIKVTDTVGSVKPSDYLALIESHSEKVDQDIIERFGNLAEYLRIQQGVLSATAADEIKDRIERNRKTAESVQSSLDQVIKNTGYNKEAFVDARDAAEAYVKKFDEHASEGRDTMSPDKLREAGSATRIAWSLTGKQHNEEMLTLLLDYDEKRDRVCEFHRTTIKDPKDFMQVASSVSRQVQRIRGRMTNVLLLIEEDEAVIRDYDRAAEAATDELLKTRIQGLIKAAFESDPDLLSKLKASLNFDYDEEKIERSKAKQEIASLLAGEMENAKLRASELIFQTKNKDANRIEDEDLEQIQAEANLLLKCVRFCVLSTPILKRVVDDEAMGTTPASVAGYLRKTMGSAELELAKDLLFAGIGSVEQ